MYQEYDHQTVELLKMIDRLWITGHMNIILVLEVYFHDWTIAHAHVHFANKEK